MGHFDIQCDLWAGAEGWGQKFLVKIGVQPWPNPAQLISSTLVVQERNAIGGGVPNRPLPGLGETKKARPE